MFAFVVGFTLAAAAPVAGQAMSFAEKILESHNRERSRLGEGELRWSDRLAADALAWAQHLATTHTFDHAPEGKGENDQGENLWMGTSGAYSAEEMVMGWVEERDHFKPGSFPNISKTGNWADVGHYSQLIWYNTTEIGCAKATNRSDDYLVCRYYPPGNWIEQNPLGPAPSKVALYSK